MYLSMTDEPDTPAGVGRRRWLSALSASLSLGIAGCLGDGEDDGPGDNGTADGDNSSGGPDDSNPDEDGADGVGDGSTDGAGGGNGSDDSGGNGSDDDGEPGQPDVPVALTNLRVAEVPITVDLSIDESAPVAVTVDNNGDTTADIPVTFAVLAGQDGVDDTADGSTGQSVPINDALASQTLTVTLVPGASERLTASGLADRLEQGSYTVTATAGDQQATLGLELFADSPVPVTVYTQAVDEEYRADSGQVTVRDDGEPVATASLDSQPVTVDLPLARTTRYTVEVSNLDGGAWPDAREPVTVDSASNPSIDVVAGYELNGALDLRFSEYILMPAEEWIGFGLYSQSVSYHFSYIESLTTTAGGPYLAPDDTPPEYGADLSALADQLGATNVSHSLGIGVGEGDYYYSGAGDQWEPADGATGRNIKAHNFGVTGPKYPDFRDDLHREYARRGSVRGTPVDIYEIPEEGGTMYVDPETGYTLRYVTHTVGDLPNSYRILDFFDHGEVPTVDWDLLKRRSVHETGESPDGETLEALPWELHQGEF